MSKFVRSSKFRHAFGQHFKKEQCFESIRLSSVNEAMLCTVNPKFMAVVTQSAGGGSFLVLPHNKTGRLPPDQPQVRGHKATVVDIAFSPFNDNLIASCDENGVIMLWEIPDGGLVENLVEPLCALEFHQKQVSRIKWHPTVSNVLLSCGKDYKVVVWNLDEVEPILELDTPEIVQDMCWNLNGSLFATVCKDRKIRVYNPRTGKVDKEFEAHESRKEQRIAFLKDNKILTTGFTKMSSRQYKLWDLDKLSPGQELANEVVDERNNPFNIFYDPDLSMFYLVGKGDSDFRYYEITDEAPFFHYLGTFQSNLPQKGMGSMPKRGLNVKTCEIMRFYKAHVANQKGIIEPISMLLPTNSDLFQSEVYPDTAANEPTLSFEEWWGGRDCAPRMMNMEQFYVEKEVQSSAMSRGLKKMTVPEPAQKQGQSHQIDDLVAQIKDLVAEIEGLKATVGQQEERIAVLEAKQ